MQHLPALRVASSPEPYCELRFWVETSRLVIGGTAWKAGRPLTERFVAKPDSAKIGHVLIECLARFEYFLP
jgi:hypothetical protein